MAKTDLQDMTLTDLTEFITDLGLPSFRARQIFSWLYRPGIRDFSQMTDIKKDLRDAIARVATFNRFMPSTVEKSADGTFKYGFKLSDNRIIESVLIPEQDRNTLCVSSQVGCAMGCNFCHTGTMGFKRNLRPAEIVNQVTAVINHKLLEINAQEPSENSIINNLVFMGMGEPLANLDNLLKALSILTEQRGLDFSDRRITVSTCGLIPQMIELGKKSKVNLAVSLHSIDDTIRSKLMPINKTYPVDDLLQACRNYPLPKRRRIMFEYILIQGINSSAADAELLAKKLKNIRCKINLLPYNDNPAFPLKSPTEEEVEIFQKILWKAGYTVLLRESRGADISAACGQLAAKQGESEIYSKPLENHN